MPITFDTLEELKAFTRSFRLDEKAASALLTASSTKERKNGSNDKPGRKPSIKIEKTAVKKALKAKVNATAKPKREKGETLTSKIQDAIRVYLKSSKSFTANDVYDVLAKTDTKINKQSVITSVLKQMNGTFKTVSVTERPGNGPRPVKLYNA
jgi:hypothetical protein